MGERQRVRYSGDINQDGKVDFADFLILAQNYGRSGDPDGPGSVSQEEAIEAETLNQNGFPLAIGNTWQYQLTYVESWPDTLEAEHFDVEWEVEAQEEVFGETAFRVRTLQSIHTIQDTESTGYTSYTWFVSNPDSLKGIASQGPLPFAEGQLFKPATSTLAEGPSSWQFSILRFPLIPGKSWPALDRSPGLATKTVIGRETVSVPAGLFETYKVRYVLAFGDDVILTWYGAIGVVKILHLNSRETVGIERVNQSLRVYELVSYELH